MTNRNCGRHAAPRDRVPRLLATALAALLLGLPVFAVASEAAATKSSRAHRRVRHHDRLVLDAPSPVIVPKATVPGFVGFDLGVLGAGISGASTALPSYPPGYGFYGPDYHGPGFGQPGY